MDVETDDEGEIRNIVKNFERYGDELKFTEPEIYN